MATADVLPETAAVHWRRRVDAAQLRLRGRLWTLTMVAHGCRSPAPPCC